MIAGDLFVALDRVLLCYTFSFIAFFFYCYGVVFCSKHFCWSYFRSIQQLDRQHSNVISLCFFLLLSFVNFFFDISVQRKALILKFVFGIFYCTYYVHRNLLRFVFVSHSCCSLFICSSWFMIFRCMLFIIFDFLIFLFAYDFYVFVFLCVLIDFIFISFISFLDVGVLPILNVNTFFLFRVKGSLTALDASQIDWIDWLSWFEFLLLDLFMYLFFWLTCFPSTGLKSILAE